MKDFVQLLTGRTDCYGTYIITDELESGKLKGHGRTYPNKKYPDPVHVGQEMWDAHLNGEQRLGIVPILLDGTCNWFVIDVDTYPVNHKSLVTNVEKKGLPLVVCRSKSGGAHLYCFLSEPMSADKCITLAKKWRDQLKLHTAEIFPKQKKHHSPDDIGNWVNMPYFDANSPDSFAFGLNAEALTKDEFVQIANAKMVFPLDIPGLLNDKQSFTDDQIFNEAPPCVQHYLKNNVPEGGSHNAGWQLAIYYREVCKATGQGNWEDDLIEANATIFEKKQSYAEIEHIIRSLKGSKDYWYLCNVEPNLTYCDKEECLKRRFGIGEDTNHYGDIEITAMIKIDSDPPVWILTVNNIDVKMSTHTLLEPKQFRKALTERLNIIPPLLKQGPHDALIAPIMAEALIVEPADEITDAGKAWAAFQEWTEKVVSRAKDRSYINRGLPWYDKTENSVWFKGEDFKKVYYNKYRDNISERDLWSALRDLGFKRKQIRVDRNMNPQWCWGRNLDDFDIWFETDEESDRI